MKLTYLAGLSTGFCLSWALISGDPWAWGAFALNLFWDAMAGFEQPKS